MIEEGDFKLISRLDIRSMLDLPEDFFDWDLDKVKRGCEILGISYSGRKNFFITKNMGPEADLFAWIKKHYDILNYLFIYEVLDKRHPSYEYYNVICFSGAKNFIDVKSIFRAEKLKAFI